MMNRPIRISSVLITGASSGIGEALALALARPGVTLHLAGRDADRLAAVVGACTAGGAVVLARVIDVRDPAAMAGWIEAAGRLDLVIANAGIAPGNRGIQGETPDQTRSVLATNLDGALNTILPAMAVMARQPAGAGGVRGRIAAIASVAAFIPLPGAAAYCASKSAIDAWMVAHSHAAARDGIRLSSVCPGFIRTPLIGGMPDRLPGLMAPDQAAARILRGVLANRVRVVFPWWLGLGARLAALLPPKLLGRLIGGRWG